MSKEEHEVEEKRQTGDERQLQMALAMSKEELEDEQRRRKYARKLYMMIEDLQKEDVSGRR